MQSAPNAQYSLETCAWCEGRGVNRDQKNTDGNFPCMGCYGQGRLQVAEPTMPCVHCGGTGEGKDINGQDSHCPRCQGSGWANRWIGPSK